MLLNVSCFTLCRFVLAQRLETEPSIVPFKILTMETRIYCTGTNCNVVFANSNHNAYTCVRIKIQIQSKHLYRLHSNGTEDFSIKRLSKKPNFALWWKWLHISWSLQYVPGTKSFLPFETNPFPYQVFFFRICTHLNSGHEHFTKYYSWIARDRR